MLQHHHQIADHGDVFHAVCILTQLSINLGEKLFSTGYHDPPHTNNAYDAASDDEADDFNL